MLLKVTEKVLLDFNARCSSIHRIHGYCSLFLLLFTVYTINVTVTVLLLLLSQHPPNILVTWILIDLTELTDNVNR